MGAMGAVGAGGRARGAVAKAEEDLRQAKALMAKYGVSTIEEAWMAKHGVSTIEEARQKEAAETWVRATAVAVETAAA